jgi:hypothetical protein
MKREKEKISGLTETWRDNQDILEKDIEQHPGKLIAPFQEMIDRNAPKYAMKEELNKIIGDYSVDLDGVY